MTRRSQWFWGNATATASTLPMDMTTSQGVGGKSQLHHRGWGVSHNYITGAGVSHNYITGGGVSGCHITAQL